MLELGDIMRVESDATHVGFSLYGVGCSVRALKEPLTVVIQSKFSNVILG